ncbi:molybdopterin converting factor subunit 1 [Deinococcus deserti]|uniref:Putative molybdenum cofactor biosynthesis protein, small and large subunit n=1 Tax=Deinococcus deserti (strain DSM 17065 / CIP 109153 / LMG 22923 / VCD115) TaxID=546414 RepID=C1CYQ1_DEIDV|nr:molybdopterin converting factor subunit 1 [Deinococcus deserti]ACO47081.2 putative molybdenum cofactor biosynthesis protein, small and large subunit [Deinococcus deserti VCD115]
MQLNVVFFARLKREIGAEHLSLNVPEGSDVRAIAKAVEEQYGISLKGCMVAVNETYATPEQPLKEGDEVAFLPPVAGGDSGADTHCALVETPLQLQDADAFLVRPECGAQAYFVGTVRSPNQGRQVEFIDYEGYGPLAQKVMHEAAQAASSRYGELRIYIEHRLGRLRPGEASILIGVASAHRRSALEACDFLIEHLKVHVPVWKHEKDEDGEHWVDGQTPHPTL